jgi:hypothetical protein
LVRFGAIWCNGAQRRVTRGERSELGRGLATGWLSRMIKSGDFEMRSPQCCGRMAIYVFEHEDTLAQGGVAGLLAEASLY